MDEMKNKFDQILRDKFQTEKFEFREEYWDGAATMIKAEKSGLLWKWVSFSLSVLVIGLTVWMNSTKSFDDGLSMNSEDQRTTATTSNHSTNNLNHGADQNWSDQEINQNTNQENNSARTLPSDNRPNSSNNPTSASRVPGQDYQNGMEKSANPNQAQGSSKATRPSEPKGDSKPDPIEDPEITRSSPQGKAGSQSKGPAQEADVESGSDLPVDRSIALQKQNFELISIGFWNIRNIKFIPMWFENPLALPILKTSMINANSDPKSIGSKSKWFIGIEPSFQGQFNSSTAQINQSVTEADSFGSSVKLAEYKLNNSMYNQLNVKVQRGYFGATIGLGVSTIRETFRYEGQAQVFEYDTTIHLIETEFGPSGSYWLLEQRIDSTGTTSANPVFEKEFRNTIRYVEVPISVFGEYPINQKWTVSGGLGVSWRIPTYASVSVLNSEGLDIDVLSSTDLNSTMTYGGYASLNRRLNPSWDLSARVSASQSRSPFSSRNNYQYSSSSIGIALTYWIKK